MSSPYLSTTEQQDTAEYFATPGGKVYTLSVGDLPPGKLKHRPRLELLQCLKGVGKGDAKWENSFEILSAKRLVELHSEHLIDSRECKGLSQDEIAEAVSQAFKAR